MWVPVQITWITSYPIDHSKLIVTGIVWRAVIKRNINHATNQPTLLTHQVRELALLSSAWQEYLKNLYLKISLTKKSNKRDRYILVGTYKLTGSLLGRRYYFIFCNEVEPLLTHQLRELALLSSAWQEYLENLYLKISLTKKSNKRDTHMLGC